MVSPVCIFGKFSFVLTGSNFFRFLIAGIDGDGSVEDDSSDSSSSELVLRLLLLIFDLKMREN